MSTSERKHSKKNIQSRETVKQNIRIRPASQILEARIVKRQYFPQKEKNKKGTWEDMMVERS